jgi:hypothetical protein
MENTSILGWQVTHDEITCPLSAMTSEMGYGNVRAEFKHQFMTKKFVTISVALVRDADVRFEVVYGDRRYAPQSFRMTGVKGFDSFKSVVLDALKEVNNNI